MAEARIARADGKPVQVWDLPVRLVHWLLVVLVATSWITSEIGGNAMTYHMWSGYAILTAVVFRIVWGFVGSRHARFASFVKGPAEVIAYVRGLSSQRSYSYLGHNPLGGWSVLAMLASLLVQASTGLFANDEIFTEGPLASRVSVETSILLTTVHRYNFYVLLTLIALHLGAIAYYFVVKRENLVAAMISGRKYVQAEPQPDEPYASPLRAALVLAVSACAVAALVNSG